MFLQRKASPSSGARSNREAEAAESELAHSRTESVSWPLLQVIAHTLHKRIRFRHCVWPQRDHRYCHSRHLNDRGVGASNPILLFVGFGYAHDSPRRDIKIPCKNTSERRRSLASSNNRHGRISLHEIKTVNLEHLTPMHWEANDSIAIMVTSLSMRACALSLTYQMYVPQ